MRLLLTGADGFVGQHLRSLLAMQGRHEVKLTDRRQLDVQSYDEFAGYLDGERFDAVVHLAARVGRENCETDRLGVIATNVGGTMQAARACAATGTRLVYVSSSEAAHDGNLYGLTKRWGEEVAELYADDLQTMRLYMPYGPGHPPGQGRAALTNFLWAAMRREPITVHRGTSRPWCWIGDTVRAMALMIEHPDVAKANIGRSDNATPMIDVARMACQLTGAPESLIRQVAKPAGIMEHKALSAQPLRSLGWRPEVDLAEGMTRLWLWLQTL